MSTISMNFVSFLVISALLSRRQYELFGIPNVLICGVHSDSPGGCETIRGEKMISQTYPITSLTALSQTNGFNKNLLILTRNTNPCSL